MQDISHKQILVTLSTTIFLCLTWTYIFDIINFIFTCEGFGCIGNGILGFGIFLVIMIIVLLCFGIWIWHQSTDKKIIKTLAYIVGIISITTVWIYIGYINHRVSNNNNLEKAYQDCLKEPKFNKGNYCEIYHQ